LKPRTVSTALVISDIHAPYHDPVALNIITQILTDTQPTYLIVNGDTVDCYGISRFLKDPTRLETLQDELNIARTILKTLKDASPKTKRIITEGNHEARLGKTIATMEGGTRELARLEDFQAALQWPSLLKLGPMGYRWVPTHQQPLIDVIPNTLIKHGTVVRKFSGYTAKGEYDNYHRSGTSGHTHRLSHFFHTSFGETHQWIETGCLCTLKPEYMNHPNWQNGGAFFRWTKDINIPSVELIHIQGNKALFNNTIYTGPTS
jgi:hypothetical protein